jgi:hypothetical protein
MQQRNASANAKYNLIEIIFLIAVLIYIVGLYTVYQMPGDTWRAVTTRTGYTVDLLYMGSLAYLFSNWGYLSGANKLKLILGEFFILLGYFYYHFYSQHPYISAVSNITFDFASAILVIGINDTVKKIKTLKQREIILIAFLTPEQKDYFSSECRRLKI